MMIPTPHIESKNKDEIAKTVLMPGDPLRAKFIADTFLADIKQFSSVRNVLGYTGTFKGRRISVMASGMGMPSIGIYSYELYKFYDVENIIRIGSCVRAANSLGIVKGVGGGKFAPNDAITRREISVMLYRALQVA